TFSAIVLVVGGGGGLSKRRGESMWFAVCSPYDCPAAALCQLRLPTRLLRCQEPYRRYGGREETRTGRRIPSCSRAARGASSSQSIAEICVPSVLPSSCVFLHASNPDRPKFQKTYATANPICATNIIRYMCAHETWFASTARSSGRRSIR